MTLQARGKKLLEKGQTLARSILKPGTPGTDNGQLASDIAALKETLAAMGKRYICPICVNEVSEFARYNKRRRARCPSCGSLERHRMVWLYLKNETTLFGKPTRLLHFAPEQCIEARIDIYMTIDHVKATYDPAKPDEGIDIQKLPFEDRSFDMIFCSHVLEHVPDDRLAMRELRRVLRDDGLAVVLVPIKADRLTYEDPTITDPAERTKHFGQFDHLRWYGRDFPDRMREEGWLVETIHYADRYSADDQLRYGIRPEPIFACRKRAQ